MAKRWKMMCGALLAALAWSVPALADLAPGPSAWEMALVHNPTGLFLLVLFGVGTGFILYGVYGMVKKRRRQ